MAVFKCKMCGGDLNIETDSSVAECKYCGSQQTVPSADNEKKLSLFSRANKLRAACDFDKASGIYESIVSEFPEEAEGYWGLILCAYGIEYVDDHATCRKIPTCHRSSFDSVLDSNDFEMVMENADPASRKVYREEAKAIEELRKSIVEISSKEEPYDIFICYKETAFDGNRTIDSVIAQEVYTELISKGYRVFFSRITLEDKLGQEYEPYIFSALNSAKIMLAFGTDYEHYNAVWVKNEWSRFLRLIEKGEKKTLIPCYKNIDAYDMPKEFARLQAQDMGKVGAVQDLLRGIEKIIPAKNSDKTTENVIINQSTANTESLLKRGFMALEDAKFENAITHFDKVLDVDVECAEAYLGLAMAESKTTSKREYIYNFDTDSGYYARAKQFADAALLKELTDIEAEYAEEQKRIAEERARRIAERKKLEAERQQREDEANRLRTEATKARILASRAKIIPFGRLLAANASHSIGLKSNGKILSAGIIPYKDDLTSWTEITAVSAGKEHIVGLKNDGTVIATPLRKQMEYKNQCEVSGWTDIVAISAGNYHTVGLRKDGTVVATGDNDDGQCAVSNWRNIVAISAGFSHTVGLTSNGTVVATGKNDHGQCNVSWWTDIIAISAGSSHTVGLKADGTVITTDSILTVWSDIIAISAGNRCTIGLKINGTVVANGDNTFRQCNISGWSDIIAIYSGPYHTLGLKKDGTVLTAGDNNSQCQCNVSKWKLFDNFDNFHKERIARTTMASRRSKGVCQYCGGAFKGMFTKTCTACGKEKDY